jgi:hypothetical protein
MESEMGGACSLHGKKRKAYRFVAGNPEGKRQLGRPGCKWYIQMTVEEIVSDEVDLILRAQDRNEWRAFVDSLNF